RESRNGRSAERRHGGKCRITHRMLLPVRAILDRSGPIGRFYAQRLSRLTPLPRQQFPGSGRRSPGPTASTVTTAPAHSTTAARNIGERIAQSIMNGLLAAKPCPPPYGRLASEIERPE